MDRTIIIIKQFSFKIITRGIKTFRRIIVLIALLLIICYAYSTDVSAQDKQGDSPKIALQVEISDDDSTVNMNSMHQSKFFYRIINPEREPIVPRRSILDRTLTLPRNVWNKFYSPLGVLAIWGERVELKRKVFEFLLNENETGGFYPNLTVGGETGASIGGVFFHNNLFDKNVKVNLEGLISGRENISTNADLFIPINSGKQNIRAELGWKIDDDEDFFIGSSSDYLGTNNSNFKDSKRLFGYERVDASVVLELFRIKSKESLIIHQTGYRETYRKVELYGGMLFESNSTDVDGGSEDREVIPMDVPGYGKTNLNSFGGFVTIDARNHPTRPYKGWLFAISGIRNKQTNGNEYSFNRLALELQTYWSFFKQNRILAVRAKYEILKPLDGDRIPFYELSTLGTTETLRGFKRSRFRDLGLLLVNFEYRYPIWDTWDGVVFYDIGQVFEKRSEISTDRFHGNIGAGFRFMSVTGYIARLQIARSRENLYYPLLFCD